MVFLVVNFVVGWVYPPEMNVVHSADLSLATRELKVVYTHAPACTRAWSRRHIGKCGLRSECWNCKFFFHKECRFGTFLEEMYLYPVVCLAWSITRSLNVPIVIRVLTTLPCTRGSYIKNFFLVLLLSRPPTRSIMATRLMWPMSDSHLTTNTCYLPEATILGENFNIILLIQGYSASFPGLPHFQYCWLCGWPRVIGLWLCHYLLLLFLFFSH